MDLSYFTSGKAALAPLAGITDSAFRAVCKKCGSVFTVSEMVSADGLIRNGKKTIALMRFTDEERPYGIQLYGQDPEVLAAATPIAAEMNPDFIDFNSGCPARKVVKRGAGAALTGNLPRLEAILKAMRANTDIPLTVKLRTGLDRDNITVARAVKIAGDCGFQAVTVHGRTLKQEFKGEADWNHIALAKKSSTIPVIGNGDITSREDAKRMFEQTGCDAVMIGRGVYGQPWLFSEIADPDFKLMPEKRLEIILFHYRAVLDDKPEIVAVREMRKHLIWYSKGIRGAANFRKQMVFMETPNEVLALTEDFFSAGTAETEAPDE